MRDDDLMTAVGIADATRARELAAQELQAGAMSLAKQCMEEVARAVRNTATLLDETFSPGEIVSDYLRMAENELLWAYKRCALARAAVESARSADAVYRDCAAVANRASTSARVLFNAEEADWERDHGPCVKITNGKPEEGS